MVALVLATVGVYGVSAQAARTRVRDVGIRVALGATHGQVSRELISKAGVFVGIGIAVGMGGAWAGGQMISELLFEIEPHDGWTLTTVAVILTAVAMCASYLPVRRVSRIDPAGVLRDE